MIQRYLLLGFRKTDVISNRNNSFMPVLLILFISAFIFLSTGCKSAPEPGPTLGGYSKSHYEIPPEMNIDDLLYPPVTTSDIPWNWYPPAAVEKGWKAIIIHHSATPTGNMALFDREHKDRGWDGVGYDFVIGNGSDSGDGQIEVTFRWREQAVGAHCKTPDNWANINGIGICLVGNFNDRAPTKRQMDSLVKLTDFLQRRYRIPKSQITGHGGTRGAIVTDCPGHMFPMSQFKSSLSL